MNIFEELPSEVLTTEEWKARARKLETDNAVLAACDHYQKYLLDY